MMRRSNLFVGIISWNSELFLGYCIDSVLRTTDSEQTRIVVLDNDSEDASRRAAEDRGVEVVQQRCNQADALNTLLHLSRSTYTLLNHADALEMVRHWDVDVAHPVAA